MPSDEEVVKELTALGRGQAGKFDQLDEDRKAAVEANMRDGYCHGVCHDWVRRVLQGGRVSFGPNAQKSTSEGYDYNARLQQQAKRQGFAWASFHELGNRSVNLANAILKQNKLDYDRAYDDYVAQKSSLLATRTKLHDDYNENAHLGEAHVVQINYGQELLEIFPNLRNGAPTALSVKALLIMFERIQQMSFEIKAPVKAGPPTQDDVKQFQWAAFSRLMDTKHPKKKSFSGISLIHLHPSKAYSSMQTTVASVTSPPPTDFINGRAMIVGVNMKTTGSDMGHAVAVHWRATNIFVMFDPNYGMFVYEELAGPKSVAAALNYLFSTVYPAYKRVTRVLNEIDYGIYAKREEETV